MPLQVCGRDQLGSHAGHQEVSSFSTRGESQGTCNATRTPPPRANKAEPTLALKPEQTSPEVQNRGISGPTKKILKKSVKSTLWKLSQ